MALVKSALITTSNGLILPAKAGIAYRIVDFRILINSATDLALFFGGNYNEENSTVVFIKSIASSELVTFPEDADPRLFTGSPGEPFGIVLFTGGVAPETYSFVRYEEV